jgi:hypothetical protein
MPASPKKKGNGRKRPTGRVKAPTGGMIMFNTPLELHKELSQVF